MNADIVKRLKFNKFNLFVMLAIALLAALLTVFFAFSAGVAGTWTIIWRMVFSFALFAVVGFFIADFLEKEYLEAFLALKENGLDDKGAKEAKGAGDAGDAAVDGADAAGADDGSFDKIVVVDEKSE
jgi:hypothetical protein